MEGGSSAGGAPSIELVIVTDPGPDPDDVKSITTSAIQHKAGKIRVHGVVCNGGHQALQRAKLARALLNYLGAHDIPVAVGSAGKPYTPQPHEYAFPGVEDVQESELREGKELIRSILERAGPHSLTFLMISAMTDIAELMQEQPELVLAKVRHLSIMGGLHRTEQPDGEGGVVWEPDTAVNNNWDMESAQLMYSFCFERGIPMSVVSRNAVPNLPMSLARDFAAREPNNPVFGYLVNAQELGLIGLWKKLCAGNLPPRCSKQWYFSTFCGVDAATFEARSYESLEADVSIREYLNGHVKPYDVCSLLLALEDASHVGAEQLAPSPVHLHGTTHRMYLEEGNQIPLDGVTELLRTTFLEVVRLGRECEAARAAAASQRENGSMGDEDRSPPRKVQISPTPDPDDLSGD